MLSLEPGSSLGHNAQIVKTTAHKLWRVAEPQLGADKLSAEVGIHPIVAQVLVNRGLSDPQEVADFLSPQLSAMRDPALLAGMDQAVTRILRALDKGEIIGVFGDYDVDGVTSTAVMTWVLRAFGAQVVKHIPHRMLEGYGLGELGLHKLREQGARLVIAVDCGVTAHQEIEQAKAMGLDVIVVDHHALDESLPDAVAVINPLRRDDKFGFNKLAAVGLTFFLAVALRRALRQRGDFARVPQPDLRQVLDLVALGTVADQVPLVDQNRILASTGLQVLRQAERPGIAALCQVANLDPDHLQSGRLAFQIAPRINAAGRLGDPMAAVDLLLTDDPTEARSLAHVLDTANGERRAIEAQVFEQALKQLVELYPDRIPDAIVLGHPDWHPGVVGIVASRMVERYQRPAMLIGTDGRGSGRSIRGFDLHAALSATRQHLLSFGGHPQAVGVRVDYSALSTFRQALVDESARLLPQCETQSVLQLEGRLAVQDLDLELAAALEQLGPYGRGNTEPVFALEGVKFLSRSTVGKNHVRFVLEESGQTVAGIAFHMSEALAAGAFGDGAKLAVVPEINHWAGRQRLSLRTVDVVAPADSGVVAGLSAGEGERS